MISTIKTILLVDDGKSEREIREAMRSMPPAAQLNEEVLETYVLGQSAPEETDAIEEHLLVCCECQDGLRELAQFITALRSTLCAEMVVH